MINKHSLLHRETLSVPLFKHPWGRVKQSIPGIREKCRNDVTWIFSSCECSQSVPMLCFWLWMLGLPPAFRRKLYLLLSWYLVQRYSGSVFQPRKQICGVSFFELLTVSLVNTGSWMTVPKCNRWQASFLEIRPFLTTLPCITDLFVVVVVLVVLSLVFFQTSGYRKRRIKRGGMYLKSMSVNSLWQAWRKIL